MEWWLPGAGRGECAVTVDGLSVLVFQDEEFWRWMMLMALQYHECITPLNCTLKNGKMVNFMLWFLITNFFFLVFETRSQLGPDNLSEAN